MSSHDPSILDGGTADSRLMRANDVLAELCRAIVKADGATEVAQDAARRLQRYFGTASVGLWWVDKAVLRLAGLALSDECEAAVADRIRGAFGVSRRSEDLPGSRAIEERRILRFRADSPELRQDVRQLLQAIGADSLVCIPIYVDGDPVGVGLVGTPDVSGLTGADESLMESALGVLGIVYHRARLQEQEEERSRRALHAYQMAMVGELAAGVAHEVNNPLSAISGLADVLATKEDLPEDVVEDLDLLRDEALRAGNIIGQLLAFARSGEHETTPVRLDDVVESVAMLHARRFQLAGVELDIRAGKDLPPIAGRHSDLQHLVHILLMNARRSMEEQREGGRVVVRIAAESGSVSLTIRDTGPGLRPDVVDRIFDPFFTTREDGGMGLGLATAYEVVRAHDGLITAENWGAPPVEGGAAGQGGARFRIQLPLRSELVGEPEPPMLGRVRIANGEVGAPAGAPDPGARPPDAGEGESAKESGGDPSAEDLRVLMVEDDRAVARSIEKLLTHLGYRVVAARTAEGALDLLETDAEVDLILSDVRMPGMGGEGFYEELRRTRPEMLERLVFASGDLISAETRRFLSGVDRPVLAKPYGIQDLKVVLERVARETRG